MKALTMFSLHDRASRLCDGLSRRECLRVGGLSALGISLPGLLQSQKSLAAGQSADSTFGKAKNCIILFMLGGPPQHETWDPKPDAPLEIRGDLRPIATRTPGLQVYGGASLANNTPHVLCDYVYKLAQGFSSFYASCHILSETNEAVRASRLALCTRTYAQIEIVLSLLGIEIPERM